MLLPLCLIVPGQAPPLSALSLLRISDNKQHVSVLVVCRRYCYMVTSAALSPNENISFPHNSDVKESVKAGGMA